MRSNSIRAVAAARSWDQVLTNATVVDNNGHTYTLHQDGDLWLIPDGMVWTDDDKFIWPEDKDQGQ